MSLLPVSLRRSAEKEIPAPTAPAGDCAKLEHLEPRLLLAADLIVTNVALVEPAIDETNDIGPAHQVNVKFTLENVGDQKAGEHKAAIVWDSDNDATNGYDAVLAVIDVDNLAADGEREIEATAWTPPDASTNETYYINVVADYELDVVENDEGNNNTAAGYAVQLTDFWVIGNTGYGEDYFGTYFEVVEPDRTIFAGEDVEVEYAIRQWGSPTPSQSSCSFS